MTIDELRADWERKVAEFGAAVTAWAKALEVLSKASCDSMVQPCEWLAAQAWVVSVKFTGTKHATPEQVIWAMGMVDEIAGAVDKLYFAVILSELIPAEDRRDAARATALAMANAYAAFQLSL
jgi:hypothetical protein